MVNWLYLYLIVYVINLMILMERMNRFSSCLFCEFSANIKIILQYSLAEKKSASSFFLLPVGQEGRDLLVVLILLI